jgi:putative aldouronate transport system permease protein
MIRVKSKSFSDINVAVVSYMIVIIALFITAYPFLYVVSSSISDPLQMIKKPVVLFPRGLSFLSYEKVLSNTFVIRSLLNSIGYTVVGTILSIIITFSTAYPLARKEFAYRKFFQVVILIPMIFSGGLIPYFLLINNLGLYNSPWAIIISLLFSPFYVVLCRSYIQSLPDELFECSRLDGCSEIRILFRIVLPLSLPIAVVLIIFFAVVYWNQWFYALVFLKDTKFYPLQLYLNKILTNSTTISSMLQNTDSATHLMSLFQIKYAAIMVTILPIILIYPFLQKYFIKGIMIGSLKG